MIHIQDNTFYLQMRSTSYWFEVTKYGHLRHLHYGALLPIQDVAPVRLKHVQELGSSIVIDAAEPTYCLDYECLEYSSFGRGDFRESPVEVVFPDGRFNLDLTYADHALYQGDDRDAKRADLYVDFAATGLPIPDPEGSETLVIRLHDQTRHVAVDLIYVVYAAHDIVLRTTRMVNLGAESVRLTKLMSMSLDLPNRAFRHVTLHGGWAKEAHAQEVPLAIGTYVNQAQTGTSSNQHNPGLMLVAQDGSGLAYGLNFIYSGNHYTSVSRSPMDLCRLQQGLPPHRFAKTLEPASSFVAPLSVLTCSDDGKNGVSAHFHDFINDKVMPPAVRHVVRPICYNNWEATFFHYDEKKLQGLAERAAKLGCEVFVLDDGWFGARDDDTKALGDYTVNPKKFKNGLEPFFRKIEALGLRAGIWVEPEMISEDSDLYRAHPEYVLADPAITPTTGRHQLVLDLANPAVRDYLVSSLGDLFDALPVTYVKWDMNRQLSDVYSRVLASQEAVYHDYVLGLYDVLRRVFTPRPHLMLEMCSSGGNRFDLGMLSFAACIWSSDDTDPIERLAIQGGLSQFYPLSALSNHVSGSPHQSTIRRTPLSTRFNVSAFGVLGYELNLKHLSGLEMKEISEQIAFYKEHRLRCQFGRFRRLPVTKANKVVWQVGDATTTLLGWFQMQAEAVEPFDRLIVAGLEPLATYRLSTKPQRLFLDRFGELIKHALPVDLNPSGVAFAKLAKHHALQDAVEVYEGSGAMFANGIYLNNQFMGSHYNAQVRMLGDFGSSLYLIERIEDPT